MVETSSVIVKLPNDSTFLDEITESIKIYKFLNKNASGARGSFDSIRRAKEDERIEKKDRIRIFIEDALKNADIYVNGDKATISAKEPATRINEALGKLVAMKYNKLKNVSISNVAGARTYSIETEQDIDKFLSEMKQKLMNELEEDTIITLS